MGDLITPDTPGLLAVAFLIGIVVGLTGMGGGALMTPALIFLGIPPTAAVANDLVAAAVNKSVGATSVPQTTSVLSSIVPLPSRTASSLSSSTANF